MGSHQQAVAGMVREIWQSYRIMRKQHEGTLLKAELANEN
jgi:hypothetical protein